MRALVAKMREFAADPTPGYFVIGNRVAIWIGDIIELDDEALARLVLERLAAEESPR